MLNKEPGTGVLMSTLVFSTLGLLVVFSCLLLNVVYKKSAEYQQGDTTAYAGYYPSYPNPPVYDQSMETSEMRMRKNMNSSFQKMMQETQDQEELQRIQRDLEKIERKYSH